MGLRAIYFTKKAMRAHAHQIPKKMMMSLMLISILSRRLYSSNTSQSVHKGLIDLGSVWPHRFHAHFRVPNLLSMAASIKERVSMVVIALSRKFNGTENVYKESI